MKQTILFLFVLLSTLVSCNNSKTEKEGTVTTDTAMVESKAETSSDSVAIRAVITGFYNWYTSNYKKLMGYDLYSSIKKNNGAPYKMNWEQVKKYQNFIRDSIPQLGDAFLVNQRQMFEKADSAFKIDIGDYVPYYFDFDWYTNSQEDPAYLLNGINKSQKWIVNVKGDEAWVEIAAPDDKDYLAGSLLLYVGLKKENGQWTIAKIGND
jgi:hypothetical protein